MGGATTSNSAPNRLTMRRAISAGDVSNAASAVLLVLFDVPRGFRGNVGEAVLHRSSNLGTAPSHSSDATSWMNRSDCPSGSHGFTLRLSSLP